MTLSHDFGKSTTYFQKYIRGEKVNNSLKKHSTISFLLTNYIIGQYLKTIDINQYYQLFSLCVKNHHSYLSNPMHDLKIDKDILKKQFNALDIQYINDILEENNFPIIDTTFDNILDEFYKLEDIAYNLMYEKAELRYEFYFLYLYLFSLLISSDKEDAIFRGKEIITNSKIPNGIEEYIKKIPKKNEIDYLRTKMFFEVDKKVSKIDLNHKIYSLNAPTGMGKTLAVFNFALKLANRVKNEKGIEMRIIYCLPFLSIIDQNYKVLYDVLRKIFGKDVSSDVLLKHHHLSEIYYKLDENVFEEEKFLHLIETWNSKIIITTFMQLFYTIFTNKNKNLKKFQALSNSIIILDEIQAIPYEYWYAINKLFKFLAEEYNIYFILCTATLPMIFDNNIEILDNKEEYFKKINRTKIKVHKNEMNLKEFIDLVAEDIEKNPDNDYLIVLNTIRSSKEVYSALKELVDGDFYYLSTSIYPKERLRRIESINKNKNRKIIVSTQLIEAGVDISVDIIYRDIAPLDCINQTAGRCNRHNEGKKGIVNVVKLVDENGRRFADYIYERHLITKTEELLNEFEIIDEKMFLNLNNKYFKKLSDYKDKSKDILKVIEKFEYEKVEKEFKLIENIPSIDLFVCIEDEAEKIWEEFERINKIKDAFERRREFLKIKREFYSYVISVPEYRIKGKDILFENLSKINEKYYDKETGFKIIEDKTIIL
nr:CRISPR-associated helicase Cas3' [Methanocaldococcus villosus]